MTGHEDLELNRRLADLIDQGLTIQHCITAFSGRQGPLQDGLADAATGHRLVEGGVLEVDASTVVSTDEDDIEDGGGGYVLAWLWVDNT